MRFGDAFAALKAGFLAGPKNSELAKNSVLQLVSQDEYFGRPPAPNALALAKLYAENPWARSIVSKIAKAVAKPKWYFALKSGEKLEQHPALDFIKAGCPRLRGRQALAAIQTYLELHGEVFLVIGRNASGVPIGYAPLPANWVLDTPSKTINWYRIQPRSGAVYEMAPEDVIHLKDINPIDPYGRGTGIANAAFVELEGEAAAANYVNSFFKNRARPDIIITGTEGRAMTEPEAARLESVWMEKFRGVTRAGKPLFASGELKLTEVGSGLRENQMSEIRTLGKENIAEIWGVPPEIFGRLSSSNKATIDSAEFLFAKHTCVPRLDTLQDYFSAFIADNFSDIPKDAELSYDSPVTEDKAHALECVKVRPVAFSDNEVRNLAGLKPLDGHDELPDPASVLPPPSPFGGPKPPTNEDKPKKSFIEAINKILNVDDVVRVSRAHEDPNVRAEVTRLFDEIVGALIVRFGSELTELLESETDFEVNGLVAEFIAREIPSLVLQIDATTRKDLAATLTEGAAGNETLAGLSARVEEIFADAALVRGSTISDTIATKLAGFTTQTAAQQGGFERKKWLSTRDHLVRDSHRALDGQIVLLSAEFVTPFGDRAQHPGAFGKAREDVNCRCAIRPVLSGEKAALSDIDYEIKYEALRGRVAEKFKSRLADVFEGQKAVVLAELKRVLREFPI